LGEDGDYHYADPQGKKWIYRKTPLRVTRMEDSQSARRESRERPRKRRGIKATEDGDIVTLRTAGAVRRLEVGKRRNRI
jgi:hypothetical protein